MANVVIPPALATGVIVLVSLMCAANFLATFFVASWTPDPTIYGFFTTAIGAAYGLSRSGKNGSSGGGEGPEA